MLTESIIILIFFVAAVVLTITALSTCATQKQPLSDFGRHLARQWIDTQITGLQRRLAYAWAKGDPLNAWLIQVRISNLARRRRKYED